MSTLVGLRAPTLSCAAVLPDGEIVDDFALSAAERGRYTLLVFYPMDFTFVCPSELIALDHRVTQFRERQVEVIGISVDSQYTHKAWRDTPVDRGGIGPVGFVLAADVKHEVCKAFGVQGASGVAYRAAFLIDRVGVVRAQIVNDLPLGRNMDELLRLVDALQHTEAFGELCPAGWRKGAAAMAPTPDGAARYLADNADEL